MYKVSSKVLIDVVKAIDALNKVKVKEEGVNTVTVDKAKLMKVAIKLIKCRNLITSNYDLKGIK